MSIDYKINISISADQFIDVLQRSGLSDRRPVEDRECMNGMVNNSNLFVSAWDDEKLVGVARSVTDFHYSCYLSDLAVDRNYQDQGIGRKLQSVTQEQLGQKCTLTLIAAPAANTYYERIGFTNNPRCWMIERDQSIC